MSAVFRNGRISGGNPITSGRSLANGFPACYNIVRRKLREEDSMEFVFETAYDAKATTAMAKVLRKTVRRKHSRL